MAGILLGAPEPLNMASRPVAWMAATIAEGAAAFRVSIRGI